MKKTYFLPLFIIFSLVLGGCSTPQNVETDVAIEIIEAEIDSIRDTKIPTTLIKPQDVDGEVPLVVFAHGFNGSRDEAGGFTQVARGLAEHGIAAILLDFPGCNDSEDVFTNYNFENMAADFDTAIIYAKTLVTVDEAKIGALGYSMGGRLVSLQMDKVDLHTSVLWAPAASNDWDSAQTFGTASEMESFVEIAQKNGTATFEFFGQDITVGEDFLLELKNDKPLDNIKEYQGNLLVITGGIDQIVLKETTDKVIQAATKTNITTHLDIPRIGHGFGIYEDDKPAEKSVVDATVAFFVDNLL